MATFNSPPQVRTAVAVLGAREPGEMNETATTRFYFIKPKSA